MTEAIPIPALPEPLYLVMAGGDAFQAEIVPESRLDDAYLLTQWFSLEDIDPERRADALAHFRDDDAWTHTEVTGNGERVQFSLNLEDGWVQVTRLPSCAESVIRSAPMQAANSGEQMSAQPAQFDEIRSLLDETYRFASTSPLAQRNLNASLELLDELEKQWKGVQHAR